jgi:hypothetical protein
MNVIKCKWENQIKDQSNRDKSRGIPSFLSVVPEYDERYIRPYNTYSPIFKTINGTSTYDWTWQTALNNKPDYVLITSWNEFFEGTAIEPSKEYGDKFLRSTKDWIKNFKGSMNLTTISSL